MHTNKGIEMVTIPMISDVELYMQQHGCINNETGMKVFFKYSFLHNIFIFIFSVINDYIAQYCKRQVSLTL